ncbi:unnamed protein product [Didymodactylos carnosus]|uniref:Uncharacterized protein n=1 Tax=Didymodactylos carnosus TaxID=1234261 RepID=A0A814ZCC1_9BILA|nr:unnamed protein product [Didymodactylos carnosus]CAF4004169.1 unnamed protein product [Didymodactylos carnosus]
MYRCNSSDIWLDKEDNLFIAGTSNNRIQKYNGTVITTVASRGLISPTSLFIDSNTGDIYILDYDKHKTNDLRKIRNYRVQYWPTNNSVAAEKDKLIIHGIGESTSLYLDKDLNIYTSEQTRIIKWFGPDYIYSITVAGRNNHNIAQQTKWRTHNDFYVHQNYT